MEPEPLNPTRADRASPGVTGATTAGPRVDGPRWTEVALAALYRRTEAGRVELLVARRHAGAVRGGLWELPGGKIEPGEDAPAAAAREVEEEVGVSPAQLMAPLEPLAVVEHSDLDVARERSIRLHAFVVEVKPGVEPEAIGSSEIRWIGLDELGRYAWPRANLAINEMLGRRLGSLDASSVPRS